MRGTKMKIRNQTSALAACLCMVVALLSGSPAKATASDPFFFIQLSDPQFGMFANNTNFSQETANFEFTVATINRLHPAFVVVTGDLVNKVGDAAQIKEYKRILAQVNPAIPVYNVAGNHDVDNVPTPETVSAYTNQFGPDHYSFHHGDFVGIVIDSNLIQAPQKVPELAAAQEHWLEQELENAHRSGARHIVVFQHHPWFLKTADEPDQYFNLPRASRVRYLALFKKFGVEHVFCGHYHRNVVARDGTVEVVTTGAVGKPLGGDKSGIQVVTVRDSGIEHHFYSLGEIPTQIDLSVVNSAR
jgi:3',5'-cyclic AMP phosphodiesterase CpdA